MLETIKIKNNSEKLNHYSKLLMAAAVAFVLVACDKKEAPGGAPGGGQGPAIGYVTAKAQSINLLEELPGRLEAYRVADVRARVAGVLQSKKFVEGSDVKAGQLLFQIDNAPYRANLQSAQASLAQARADLMRTKAQAERYKPLVAVNAISKQDYDNAVAAQRASEASVAAANAAIQTANINLGYAAVTSPISGRVGRALVTEGALVGQGVATELAVVQQIDPLYVNFTQPATDVINLQRAIKSGDYAAAGEDGSIPITVVLSDGSVYEHQGKLLFTDLTVDQTTGQVSLRATLPNPEGLLLPGLYVRVKLEQIQAKNSYLLPQEAVTRTATGGMVNVINAKNHIEPRPITIGGRKDQNWVVTGGLAEGERVMVDGLQKWQMAIGQAMQQMQAAGQEVQGLPPVEVMPVSRDKDVQGQVTPPVPEQTQPTEVEQKEAVQKTEETQSTATQQKETSGK